MKQLILVSACVVATSFAFAQSECVTTAVNLTGNQMTLTTSGAKSTTWRENYVYYERKHQRKRDKSVVIPGVAAKFPSKPILLNTRQDVTAVPEKYNVAVAVPEENMTACPDSQMNVAATLSVERVASYTGNYPANKTEPVYHEVSKRHYKIALRQKRKIERKQEKIARRAKVNVQVKSANA